MNCPILNAGKPSLQVVPEKYITLTKGDILILTCKVNEETKSVIWKKYGDTITEREIRDHRSRVHKLVITEVVEKDSGEYSCEARNKPGTVARSVVTVNVKSKLFKQPNIILIINYVRSLL